MWKGKRQSFGTAQYYVRGRNLTLKRYLNEFYPVYDWFNITRFFMQNPIQAKIILDDFGKSNEAKLKLIAELFVSGKSKIVYIVGARGSGKTATAFKQAEEVHNLTNRKVFYVSSNVDEKLLPNWMTVVKGIGEVPKGSFCIIDESAIQFSARDFSKEANKLLSKELAIARHREIFLIFITQHISMSDINIYRMRDMVIWKRSNDYSLGDRSKASKESKFYDKIRNMMSPRAKNECLFEYPSFRRFIHFKHTLPDCWSDELSKSWKDAVLSVKKEEEFNKRNLKKRKIKEIII